MALLENTSTIVIGAKDTYQQIFKPAFLHPELTSQFDVMTGVEGTLTMTLPEYKKRGLRSYNAPRSTETISGQPTLSARTITPEEMTSRMHFQPQEAFGTMYSGDVDPRDRNEFYGIFIEQNREIMRNDLSEIAWWGDKTLASPAADLAFFQSINGLWKRLEVGVGDGDITRVNISSYNGSAISGANAEATLDTLWKNRSNTMRQLDKSRLVYQVTPGIYDAYEDYLKGLGTEEAHRKIINGYETLTYNGIPLMEMTGWDIRLTEVYGANRHRAILTDRMNLKVAGNTFGRGFKVWFSDDDDMWKSQAYVKLDTNWVHSERTLVAY